MIPQEQQVTNLDLSRRLEAAGVPQDSQWYWCDMALDRRDKGSSWYKPFFKIIPRSLAKTRRYNIGEEDEQYAAFSPSELGEWLPNGTSFCFTTTGDFKSKKLKDEWVCSKMFYPSQYADTLADAMGEMLDYLINNGYVKVKELK